MIEKSATGQPKKGQRQLKDEAQARLAAEKMARELVARGFVEQSAPAAKAKPAVKPPDDGAVNLGALFDEDEEPVGEVLPRIAAPPTAEESGEKAVKKKKKSGKKKQKKKGGPGQTDDMDKKATVAIFSVGGALILLLSWFVYDSFLKPPSIVGDWKGSKLEYEIGHAITNTQYALSLDAKHRATMTLQETFTSTGTYSVQGKRLNLDLKDEDGGSLKLHYKIVLGRSTMELYDEASGQKVVQLVRQSSKPSTAGGSAPPPPAAPTDIATEAPDDEEKAADARLASVDFSPKDGAFQLRHPPAWKVETGSRPDNTYSWGRFTQGSAKIQVFADVAGSLMSGSDSARNHEEGSVMAPVHNAHVLGEKTAKEEFSDYAESEPTLFKGSSMGEGRMASFNASAGGLFGGKLRGFRVTLLTNNRRITILCSCPEGEFEKFKPTFLAVCRSLSR